MKKFLFFILKILFCCMYEKNTFAGNGLRV